MKTIFKKIAITAVSLSIVMFSLNSCADDIILEPLESLLGNYEGHFTLTDLSSGDSEIKVDQDIEWVFRDDTYDLDDSTSTICSPTGDYEMNGADIVISEVFPGNDGSVCDPSLNPIGTFSLQRPDDSLILTQSTSELFIEIRLKRAQ